ncbi:MAG: hypothetical protein GAK45_00878 [Pseudomonas citronellolis]|nr:MAG: hypothetical protein GAK45_00878 [Pseudomonas citronellolis]
MSEIAQLHLQYKGERTYLHGTDIYTAVNELAGSLLNGYVSRIAFRKVAQQALIVVDALSEARGEAVADVTVASKADNAVLAKWWLVETETAVAGRYPYEEQLIARACNVDLQGRRLSKSRNTDFSLIEEIVAAHKVLCRALAADADGRWLFAQLQLSAPLEQQVSTIEQINTAMLNGRMAASDLKLDGTKVGTIRFMRG